MLQLSRLRYFPHIVVIIPLLAGSHCCYYPIVKILLLSQSYYCHYPIHFTILLLSRSECLPYEGSNAEIGWLSLELMNVAAKLTFFLELSLQE
jgi:hypothetical protein